MKYKVCIWEEEIHFYTIEVEADSKKSAVDKAWEEKCIENETRSDIFNGGLDHIEEIKE